MLAPLFASLFAGCTPVVDATGGVSEDSADTGEAEQLDLDPMVGSYFPDDYAPTSPARVVFLGDSITAGNGASRAPLSYTRLLEKNNDDAWPDAAELDLPALFAEMPEIVDESLAGATTSSMMGQQIPHVTEDLGDSVAGATAVVLTIAGNDVQSLLMNPKETDATVENITENLAELYDYFQDPVRFPDGAYIYLANVYEPSDGVGQADECFYGLNLVEILPSLDAANNATRTQAEERGVAWIDMRGHFLGHGYHAADPENEYYSADDPSLWFADDCIHPNDRGHHEIRRLFWYALAGQEFPGDVPEGE